MKEKSHHKKLFPQIEYKSLGELRSPSEDRGQKSNLLLGHLAPHSNQPFSHRHLSWGIQTLNAMRGSLERVTELSQSVLLGVGWGPLLIHKTSVTGVWQGASISSLYRNPEKTDLKKGRFIWGFTVSEVFIHGHLAPLFLGLWQGRERRVRRWVLEQICSLSGGQEAKRDRLYTGPSSKPISPGIHKWISMFLRLEPS